MCCGAIVRAIESFFKLILKSIQWVFFAFNALLVVFGLISFALFIYIFFEGDGDFRAELADEVGLDYRTFNILWLIAEIFIGIAEFFAWTGCRASGVNLNLLCFKTGKKSQCGLTIYSCATMIIGLALLIGASWVANQGFSSDFESLLHQIELPNPSMSSFSNSTVDFEAAHECCGIDFIEASELVDGQAPPCGQWQNNIPFGCECPEDKIGSNLCMNATYAQQEFHCVTTVPIYSQGCIAEMTSNLDFLITAFSLGGFLTSLVMIICSILSLILCCAVDDDMKILG